MKKLTMLMTAMLMAGVAFGAVTTHLSLDCRPLPREVADGEILQYNAAWTNGANCVVTCARDGESETTLATGSTGSVEWLPDEAGVYSLALTTFDAYGQSVARETVQFFKPPVIEIITSGCIGDDVFFNAMPDGWDIHYTLDGSVPGLDAPVYDGSLVLTNAAQKTLRAIAMRMLGQQLATSLETSRTFDFTPYSNGSYNEGKNNATWNFTVNGDLVVVTGVSNLAPGKTCVLPGLLGNRPVAGYDCHALDNVNVTWTYVNGYKMYDGWIFGYTQNALAELPENIHGVADGALDGCPVFKPDYQVIGTRYGDDARFVFTGVVSGGVVHYTLDGTEATENSPIYSEPIVLQDRTRVRAVVKRVMDPLYGQYVSGELDVVISLDCGSVGSGYASVQERYPNGYSYLTNVTVEAGANVDTNYFKGCSSLVKVSLPDRVKKLDCHALDELNVEWEYIDGYKMYDGWVFGYTENAAAELPEVDSIRGIADGALDGCTALQRLVFSEDAVIHYIGDRAVRQATELQTLILPPSLEWIGDDAFYACSYLGNVIVPYSVEYVGARAFKNCTGFTHAQIQYGVGTIGAEAFYGDWRITEVDIPSTVTNIGVNAFGGDSSIIRVGLRGDIRPLRNIFSTYASIREVTVKHGDSPLVGTLFNGCSVLTTVQYQGDCPALESDNIYGGTSTELTSYVSRTSTGWDGTPGSHSLPRQWPLTSTRRNIEYWDVPSCAVRFDSQGGGIGVQTVEQYSEKPFTLPAVPTRTGYEFAGWWTLPDGGLAVTADTIFIEGVYEVVYAHWIRKIWVTFDPNGGTVDETMLAYAKNAVYGEMPVPVLKGHNFSGWQCDGVTVGADDALVSQSDHTLVAAWTPITYSIVFDANGGTGTMPNQTCTYNVFAVAPACGFVRAGYAFSGWGTNATEVVYSPGDDFLNLAETQDAEVPFHAIWAKDDSNLEFESDGDADWFIDNTTHEGAVVWRSGAVGDGQRSVLRTTVSGAGAVSFWWKVDCEKYRTYKLDYLAFFVDGVEQQWINGNGDWAQASFAVEGSGTHVLEWRYVKDEEGADGEDCGWVSEVVWEATLNTLGDYLNNGTLGFATSGNANWYGVKNVSHDGVGSLRSGAVGDSGKSRLEATVNGPGEVSFWWKVSCESYRTYKLDHVSFYIDGVEQQWINGEKDWAQVSAQVSGAGAHTLAWVYEKDEEGSGGEDCAWLDEVVWSAAPAPADPIPALPVNATASQVAAALAGSADAALAANITDAATYNAYRTWAGTVKNAKGTAVGASAVKASANAWLSFALDARNASNQPTLVASAPAAGDLAIVGILPQVTGDGYALTVELSGVRIGASATEANLRKVFGAKGAYSLTESAFSEGNVTIVAEAAEDGKVKMTVRIKNAGAAKAYLKAWMR